MPHRTIGMAIQPFILSQVTLVEVGHHASRNCLGPLLLLATALLPNRTTESFQMEAGPLYDKQRIQMELRSGNTVLIYFRSGVDHYQSVDCSCR